MSTRLMSLSARSGSTFTIAGPSAVKALRRSCHRCTARVWRQRSTGVRRGSRWLGRRQQQRHVLYSPREVRKPTQRRTIHPLQIVNDQNQRRALRQPTRQRHQRMADQERAIGLARHSPTPQPETKDVRRWPRWTGEQLLTLPAGERVDLALE
jgi:hypothetical protein